MIPLSAIVAPLAILWDAKTKLLFVNIPRNAGTSIEQVMSRVMERRDGPAYHARTYDDRNLICPACVPNARRVRDGKTADEYSCGQALGATGTGFITDCIHNFSKSEFVANLILRRCRNYTGSTRSFAVVRNPLDRLISGYNAEMDQADRMMTFRDWVHKSRIHRFKRPQLESISACTIVFAYERMSDVWDFLQSQYPAMERVGRVDAAAKPSTRPPFVPHPDTVAEVMSEYRDDWELWLSAISRSDETGWWRKRPPCAELRSLNSTGLSRAVDTAWRALSHGQKNETLRGERPKGTPAHLPAHSPAHAPAHARAGPKPAGSHRPPAST